MGFHKKISADEAHRCPQCAQPTCLPGCPLGIDIPGFIRFLKEGDADSALERIKKDNPFPAICGRICPAPCEKACIFSDEGSPIAIRALERYASDFGRSKVEAGHARPAPTVPSGPVQGKNALSKKIAIIGSGPSAMTAAWVLLKKGFNVVMFEATDQPGGILRYGIPEFRLPQKILDLQFEELKAQGLELHTNVLVGRIKPFQELVDSFDAVLLAVGASLPQFSSLEGENLAGVYYAAEFLMRLQMASKEHVSTSGFMFKGNQTMVVGSGHAALDAGRMAARLGQSVRLIFDGLEEQIGVSTDELKEALDEGIKFQTPFEVLKIVDNHQGCVAGVQCRRMEITEKEGHLSLQPVQELEVIEAQTVVLANGQRINDLLVETRHCPVSTEKIFTAGSAVSGPITVVEAMASGKGVARQIAEYLTR